MGPSRRVTLRDLARTTGVHFTTVGLALRGDVRVRPETVEKVREAAERLGYQRDAMLSALSSYRHTRGRVHRETIGYLFPAPFRRIMERNDGYRTAYLSAEAHAETIGLKVEPFDSSADNMKPRRLAQLLESRGIRGLVIAPIFEPGEYGALPWERFSAVALGFSLTRPELHRVAVHHARAMRLMLRELRALGYRRIGLALRRGGDVRTDHNFLGAYLAEQQVQADSARLHPLLCEEEVPALPRLKAWLTAERPDCVIGAMPDTLGQIRKLGWRVPGELGFALLGLRPNAPDFAGTDENWGAVGQAAIDLVFALMKNRETGIPDFPRFALVEAKWVWGGTVRGGERVSPSRLIKPHSQRRAPPDFQFQDLAMISMNAS
jgi:LacI family transcriptional regulator